MNYCWRGIIFLFKNQEHLCWFFFFFFCRSDCYTLSVLRRASSSSMDCVKHYRISCLQNNWVYISARNTFPSLHHLVEHYSGWRAVHVALLSCLSNFKTHPEISIKKKFGPISRDCRWTVLSTHTAVLHQGPRQSQGGQAWTYNYEKVDHQLEGHQQVWQILPILITAAGPSLSWANY